MTYPGKEHARKTLHKLLALLPPDLRTQPQAFLLAGEQTPYRNDTDRELPFRQESNFIYLTGCSVPGSFVLVITDGDTQSNSDYVPEVKLFLPEIQEADLMWSIPPPTLDTARDLFDSTSLHPASSLPSTLSTLSASSPNLLIHILPQTTLFPTFTPDLLHSLTSAQTTSEYLLSALHHARLIKDEHEIDLIRKANAISSRAHETVMRVLGAAVRAGKASAQTNGDEKRPLLPSEWLIEREEEAEAIFVASCRREGAVHQAYLPIVAGSHRASTLHYTCNCESLGPNRDALRRSSNIHPSGQTELLPQVLLIDAGCEWECHASDITRTMPVGNGGHFTPEARAIYELVHTMQATAFGMLKPGVHWDKVHLATHRVLVLGLLKLGILRSGDGATEEEILNSGVTAAFYPHGLGHSLGMDVHDVPSVSKPDPKENKTLLDGKSPAGSNEALYTYLRLRLPLEAGMVVTVEPGCYFHPHLLAPVKAHRYVDREVLKRYEGMGGVRIEDVVVIKESGYENLTTVRSDVEWVEGVCSGGL